ncbi:hypothetical protein M2459_001512 [Parabacteroides sp. PF5-5]|uniref:hypothetical protein n=1 Tax=unclassified Parabacteroides TaxID=2649774 RepID=UPI002476F8E6|nr:MULTISPECIES: hypothetical protein [unclassified Parabacteroides]MDH6304775.1 hypothetical protein [Parabacteroides sp. PH5-39]MDH6315610.1 hypothetical protein [Parabacteroides sp. PF5-13]MDH6319271.1 hypothetical protein [Parabacteroides sp. PH5-13]MDH6323002.1 hypothetical protein [Parabacteroides sp. PH5-8]MDH6326803.1 hypothetical protein [Parabacteroides sp. PH5-41]
MKKSIISLMTLTAFVFCLVSCGGKKAKEDEAKTEEAAVIAGNMPKSLLTEEVKTETVLLLKDMPSSEIPYRVATSEVTISVGDLGYMLPVAKASELNSASQKARACGMYFTDYNVKKAMGQPTAELEGVLAKLTSDLNITFVMNILKESAPQNASKEDFAKFIQSQEDKVLQEMINNDKIDVQIEMLSGIAAESACVYANPSLVVKGDATSAGLSDNMMKRLDTLSEVTADLAAYYPDLKELGATINPLKEKVTSIQTARTANAEIISVRDNLLK